MKLCRLTLIVVVAGMMPVAVRAGGHKNTTTVTETKTEDTGVFTGTIQSVDAAKAMLTVSQGHEVYREEKIKKTVAKTAAEHEKEARAKKAEKTEKATKNTAKMFQVPTMCKIVTEKKPNAFFADLKTGDAIDVAYHVLNSSTLVADTIEPPNSP